MVIKLSKNLIKPALQNHMTKNFYSAKYITNLQQGSKPALCNLS